MQNIWHEDNWTYVPILSPTLGDSKKKKKDYKMKGLIITQVAFQKGVMNFLKYGI